MPCRSLPPRVCALALWIAAGLLSVDVRASEDPVVVGPQSARAPDAGPFAIGTDTLEITGVTWIESWNANVAADRLRGIRIVLGRDWYPAWQWIAELELQHAELGRSPDAVLAGLSGLVRRRMAILGRSEPFVEFGLGAALATRAVPASGTAFNFLLQAGAGFTHAVNARASLVAGMRLWHLSNGGIIKNDSRNPDIEGIGGYVGVQVHFR
jgi:hypothetical protein